VRWRTERAGRDAPRPLVVQVSVWQLLPGNLRPEARDADAPIGTIDRDDPQTAGVREGRKDRPGPSGSIRFKRGIGWIDRSVAHAEHKKKQNDAGRYAEQP
jgi:hypothetical protein